MTKISRSRVNRTLILRGKSVRMRNHILLSLLTLFCFVPIRSQAQEYKGLAGGGIGYSTNLQELKTVGANLVGELPLKRGSSFYANFHWSMGVVTTGRFHMQSNLAAVATFIALTEDEQYTGWAGETAALLMIIPTGFTYYAVDSLPSRIGIYLNPFNGEYYEFSDKEDVLAYAPEIGMKYMHQLYRKTFLYFSAGCAYTMAIEGGSSNIKPVEYQDGLLWKFTAGIVFYGSANNKQGATKPKN